VVNPALEVVLLRLHQLGATLGAFGATAIPVPLAEEDGSMQRPGTRFIANSER
jgi:hypothetical protein